MSKICLNCGAALDDEAVFCSHCKHNPDEEKKKRKLWPLFLFLAALAVGVTIAVISCSGKTKGMEFIRVGDIGDISDEKTRDLVETLSYLSECGDDDYICILTDEASGTVRVPGRYENADVVYLTAYPGACRDISSLGIPKQVVCIEHVCDFDSDCDTLTSVTSAEKTSYLSDCFNRCTSLEKVSIWDVCEMKRCFNYCPSIEKIAGFYIPLSDDEKHNIIESSYCGCDGLEELDVKHVESLLDCFNNCAALHSVELGDGLQIVNSSFSDCGAVDHIYLGEDVNTVINSFNDCVHLEELLLPKTRGAIDYCPILTLENAFNNCAALTTLDMERGVFDIVDSLNDCPALSDLNLPGSVSNIQNAFNRCGSLKTLALEIDNSLSDSFDQCSSLDSLSVMIADCIVTRRIANAFNDCKNLKTFSTNANIFENAFNGCTSLDSVKLKSKLSPLVDSFGSCPIDVAAIKSDEEIEYERQKKREEEEARKISNHYGDLFAIVEEAWQKLADCGAISLNETGNPVIDFEEAYTDDGERCDLPVFRDASVDARLSSAPDLDLDQIVLMYSDCIYDLNGEGDSRFDSLYAVNYDECRYIIVYDGFTSKRIENYYQEYVNGVPGRLLDRLDTTTLVYIVDVKEKEIVAVHSVGTDVPPDINIKHVYGEVLNEKAEDYIRSLLE